MAMAGLRLSFRAEREQIAQDARRFVFSGGIVKRFFG